MSSPLLPTDDIDVTGLDRQSLLSRARTLAYQADPDWQDFSPNFAENILLEAEALLISAVLHSMNEKVRQLSLALVTDRLACIRATRFYGFRLVGSTPAQVSGEFYLPNSALATVDIPLSAGFRVRAGSQIFSLLEDTSITVGANSTDSVTVEHSETQEDTFTSDETANQVLLLEHGPYIDDSIEIVAGNGTYYFRKESGTGARYTSFLEMGPDTRGFIVLVDNNGRPRVIFGNGINGAIPKGAISITYKTGGGLDGRVDANYPNWQTADTAHDENDTAVTILFRNTIASVGGFEAMTVDEARVLAPQARRTIQRCVNEPDFEYVATTVPGIARAGFVGSNQNPDILENRAYLYLVAYGSPYSDTLYYPPASPSTAQISAVQALIVPSTGDYPALLGEAVTVMSAVFYDIDVAVRIYKAAKYTAAQVKLSIVQALQKFFAVADAKRARNLLMNFGYNLKGADGTADYKVAWSHVFNAINDAPGVREVSSALDNLLLNEVRQSAVLDPHMFPRLGTITVYDMDSNGVQI